MNEASRTLNLPTSPATPSITSSPESAAGAMPFDSPDGLTTALSGQAHAPASRSARQDSSAASTTPDTSGPSGTGSSESRALTLFLASRLQARASGSTLFQETWREKATPSGRQYWAHTASARRTSGSASTGWPTAQRHDDRLRGNTMADHHYFPHDLPNAAELASWPSPMAGTPAQNGNNEAGNNDSSRRTVALASSWVSPQKGDGDRGGQAKRYLEKKHAVRLNDQSLLTAAAWSSPRSNKRGFPDAHGSHEAPCATASSRDWKDTPGMSTTGTNRDGTIRSRMDQLPRQASGVIPTGSSASTEKPGQLNPAHSRWLMGYPAAWDACADTATLSSRKSQRRSSKPISKSKRKRKPAAPTQMKSLF